MAKTLTPQQQKSQKSAYEKLGKPVPTSKSGSTQTSGSQNNSSGDIRYYKYYVNNKEYIAAMPWAGNVPYGYSPITSQEYAQKGGKDGLATTAEERAKQDLGNTGLVDGETQESFTRKAMLRELEMQYQKGLLTDQQYNQQVEGVLAKYPTQPNSAQDLVKQILSSGNTTNLQSNPTWSSSPYKQEAWTLLQDTMSSPEKLANFVKTNGITDLQNKDWWANSPHKQQAWNIISAGSAGAGGTGGTGGGTTTQPGSTPSGDANLDAAMKIIDSSSLPEAIKALYRQAVKTWDPSKSINAQNIIDTFKQISETTIDPYYKELSKVAADTYSRSYKYGEEQRKIELETQNANAAENISQTQEALAKRGMTFSGQAVKALGDKSAFGQPGDPNAAIPTMTAPFEGQINQANRLVATSSQARYQKNMEDLARQTEAQLGSAAAAGITPGVAPLGGIGGTLPMQKQQQEASTLENLINQQNYNEQTKKPLTINV